MRSWVPSHIMRIGFTGTRHGMSAAQQLAVRRLFETYKLSIVEMHHGDCIGADAQAHVLMREVCLTATITIWPCVPLGHPARAGMAADITMPVAPALQRNLEIVEHATMLIATPQTDVEVIRSGTWATIRYGRKLGLRGRVILPNGSITVLLPPTP